MAKCLNGEDSLSDSLKVQEIFSPEHPTGSGAHTASYKMRIGIIPKSQAAGTWI